MPSLSRYRIHKNLVPSRRNTTPSFSIGLAILHLLSEGRAECFEFRFEEPDVSTHYAEMGNLLSLNPKIHSLWAHAKIPRSFPNCEWVYSSSRLVTLGLSPKEFPTGDEFQWSEVGERLVGAHAVVGVFPMAQLVIEPQRLVRVGVHLIELFMVGAVRALHVRVQLR